MSVITKEKGDIGLTKVIADLTEKGVSICLPISEHLPFDLIAVYNNQIARVSVKYKSLNHRGSIEMPLRTISSNSKGYNVKPVDLTAIEAFAIYSPDTKQCYYISSKEIIDQGVGNVFTLRVDPLDPKYKNRSDSLRWAHSYLDFQNLFTK